jgi:hypothetical protein
VLARQYRAMITLHSPNGFIQPFGLSLKTKNIYFGVKVTIKICTSNTESFCIRKKQINKGYLIRPRLIPFKSYPVHHSRITLLIKAVL